MLKRALYRAVRYLPFKTGHFTIFYTFMSCGFLYNPYVGSNNIFRSFIRLIYLLTQVCYVTHFLCSGSHIHLKSQINKWTSIDGWGGGYNLFKMINVFSSLHHIFIKPSAHTLASAELLHMQYFLAKFLLFKNIIFAYAR